MEHHQQSTGPETISHDYTPAVSSEQSASEREHSQDGAATPYSAILHGGLTLTKHPDRGREFVCSAKEGFPAGVCVLVEQPVVTVLDSEVQREKGAHVNVEGLALIVMVAHMVLYVQPAHIL